MKLWALAITDASSSELVLLVHPLVQLIIGVMRLNQNLKYFPFHVKLYDLATFISQTTGQFLPIVQHILLPFENMKYFNSRPKPLEDKSVPDTLVALKIAKKHFDTQVIKDRIIKESIEALTLFYGANSKTLSFPELVVPTCVVLRKFRKMTSNNAYRKTVGSFLELIKRNEDHVVNERAKIAEKSLRDPAKLHQ